MATDPFDNIERPQRTLRELALHHYNLRLICRRCGYVRILQGHCLWWLFERRRWSDHLEDVARRLWCARCWIANRRKEYPRCERTRDPPTGDPLPYPDEREWKKVVARHRS